MAETVTLLLSSREREVAELVGNGLCDADIAKELGIAEKTVHAHLYNIYHRNQIHTRHRLAFLMCNLIHGGNYAPLRSPDTEGEPSRVPVCYRPHKKAGRRSARNLHTEC